MTKFAKWIGHHWTVVGWTAISCVLLLADAWMFEMIWVLGLLIQLAWAFVGVCIFFGLVILGRWRSAIVQVALATALFFSPLPVWGAAA